MKSARLTRLDPRRWPFLLGLSLLWLLAKVPSSAWPSLSRGLGAVLRTLVPSRRLVVQRNLELAFPSESEEWRAQLCNNSYQVLATSLFETSKLWFADPRWMDDYVILEGVEHLQVCQEQGEAVILLSCHYCSIELAGAALCRTQPFYPVYAAAKNAMFDQFQQEKRLRFAPGVVLRSDMRKAMRVLREGQILWMLPDQSVASSHGAVPTHFFNQQVLSTTAPARLQNRSAAKLVVFELHRRAGKLVVTVCPPIERDSGKGPVEQAQELNHLFEQMICRSPQEYFWHHKRFKSGVPGINPYA